MEHIPQNDILHMALTWLNSYGEGMRDSSTVLLYAFRIFNISVFLLNIVFITASIGHIESKQYIHLCEGASTVLQCFVKYALFLYYKPDIKKLLGYVKSFWNCKSLGKKFYANANILFRNIKIIQYCYLTTAIFTGIMYFLKPFFNSNSTFLFECWTFSHSLILETIILFCQYYNLLFLLPIGFTYDAFYLAYCIHIIVQLRSLKYKFKYMTYSITTSEMNSYIQHHQMLLSIFDHMKKIYFWILLFSYFVTLATGCSLLYAILLGNTQRSDLVTTLCYISGLFVEFGYYSFPVEEIVFEFTDVSNAIYTSSWFDRTKEIKGLLLFVMTKAQRQKYMSAAGILDINVDAFGSVIRKTFSFYAILKNLMSK